MAGAEPPAPSSSPPGVAHLFPLALGQAVRNFGYAIYYPFFTLYIRNVLGISYGVIGTVFFALGLLSLPALPIAGYLSDHWGRRKTFLFSLGSEAIGIVLLFLAMVTGSFAAVVAASAFLNPLSNMSGPAQSAYVADWVSRSKRTMGYSWVSMASNTGFAAGVSMGGLLLGSIGFLGVVFLTVVIIVGMDLLLFVILPPSPTDRRMAALRTNPPTGAPSGVPLSTASGGPGLFEWVGRSVKRKFRDTLAPLQSSTLLLVATAFLFLAMLTGALQIAFPLFVNNELGVSYALLGIAFGINGLILAFGQVPLTRLVLGRRFTSIGAIGALVFAASLLLIAEGRHFAVNFVVVFLLGICVLTVGEILISITRMTLPSNMAQTATMGRVNAITQTFTFAGGLGSLLYSGILLGAFTNPLVLWTIFIAPGLAAAVLLVYISARILPTANRA